MDNLLINYKPHSSSECFFYKLQKDKLISIISHLSTQQKQILCNKLIYNYHKPVLNPIDIAYELAYRIIYELLKNIIKPCDIFNDTWINCNIRNFGHDIRIMRLVDIIVYNPHAHKKMKTLFPWLIIDLSKRYL